MKPELRGDANAIRLEAINRLRAACAHVGGSAEAIKTSLAELRRLHPRAELKLGPLPPAKSDRTPTGNGADARPDAGDKKSKTFKGKCHYCGRPGHKSADCRKRIQDEKNQQNVADEKDKAKKQ